MFDKGLMGYELDDGGHFERGCLVSICTVAEDYGLAIDTHLTLYRMKNHSW